MPVPPAAAVIALPWGNRRSACVMRGLGNRLGRRLSVPPDA